MQRRSVDVELKARLCWCIQNTGKTTAISHAAGVHCNAPLHDCRDLVTMTRMKSEDGLMWPLKL